MYSLKVLKDLQHPDGRNFAVGHDCKSLDAFEVSELIADYPEYFEPADEATVEFIGDAEKVKHLAEAVRRKHKDFEAAIEGLSGSVKARKK